MCQVMEDFEGSAAGPWAGTGNQIREKCSGDTQHSHEQGEVGSLAPSKLSRYWCLHWEWGFYSSVFVTTLG